jgi:hypothetical protein
MNDILSIIILGVVINAGVTVWLVKQARRGFNSAAQPQRARTVEQTPQPDLEPEFKALREQLHARRSQRFSRPPK